MKKTLIATIFLMSAIWSIAQQQQKKEDSLVVQPKKDTTIQIVMSLDQFRSLLYAIDANIDSKKASRELIEFIQKSAAIKPKEQKQ